MKIGIIKSIALAGLACVSLTSAVRADAAAEAILKHTRYAATLQQQDLRGNMKKNGVKTPVSLFLRGKDIQFSYQIGGISQKINGTDLSFEDLSMRFLYWKKSKIEGEERISSQKCYRIRLENPGKTGDYSIVNVWVHKKFGSLMKVVGYDHRGMPLKQFQVTDLMKVGKEYTLKRMRVDSYDPKTET